MSGSSSLFEPGSSGSAGGRYHAYSRKQKSLGLLCSNFVSLYDRDDVESVGLDDAARRLGVERRRIYDIVNVLESVGVLAKKAKNRYSWIGFPGIPKALENLKAQTSRGTFGAEGASFKSEDLDYEEDDKSLDHSGDNGEEKLCIRTKPECFGVGIENRREKSLGMLTENFVKLFLTTEAEAVSLDEAARLLLGDAQDPNHMKSYNAAKVRRLYDIANVLSSLNLIEKTQQLDTRKPAFRWLGFNGRQDSGVTISVPPVPGPQQGLKRGFGMDITNVDLTKRSKLVPSDEKKPNRVHMRSEDMTECNLMVQKQLQGSKDVDFGPFTPLGLVMEAKNDDNKGGKQVQDWESLSDSHRPEYQNQALSELFAHYVEAWKRWYAEIVQVSEHV